MADIFINIKGGEPTAFSLDTPVREILKGLLSKKERKSVIAVSCDGNMYGLSDTLASIQSAAIEIIPVAMGSPEGLKILRHSCSHIMAEAVRDLYPGVKVAIGPAIEDGFYYDFDLDQPFSPDDFPKIEKRMQEIISSRQPFTKKVVSREEALGFFDEQGEKYKVELIEEITDETVSLYEQGGFVDLCRGPHLPDASLIPVFKVLKVAGAYWRGDEKRPMLQRLYATAFSSKKELAAYLHKQEEAKKRDHRKLGRDLELFTIQDDVGPGLVLWQPKGALMRTIIEDFWRTEHYRHGYELLFTPHIARQGLWQTSGHLDFYSENMYAPMDIDGVAYQLKPMNCPFHINIYKAKKRSYREFPIRWCELGTVYRYERTGVLHGLMRVRGFTQDDAHIFCRPDQLEDEIYNILDLNLHILSIFGFDEYDVYLSTRPEKYVGSEEHWQKSTEALKLALEKKGLAYEIDPGEGVFYGPKIDIKIKDVLGRSWQCSTIQVDFNLPERFDIGYTGSDGNEHQPIMVHRALMGSLERFYGVLIEHHGGAFPVWLSPVQARIMNITDNQAEYCQELLDTLRKSGIRVEADLRNEKLNLKIRDAQLQKIPYMLVIGDREKESHTMSVRLRSGENLPAMDADGFCNMVHEACGSRA